MKTQQINKSIESKLDSLLKSIEILAQSQSTMQNELNSIKSGKKLNDKNQSHKKDSPIENNRPLFHFVGKGFEISEFESVLQKGNRVGQKQRYISIHVAEKFDDNRKKLTGQPVIKKYETLQHEINELAQAFEVIKESFESGKL